VKRKIAVVTTSRADYSLLYWPLRELAARPELDLKIVALGPHLSPEFGCTVQEIEKDGFRVDARVECLMSSDSDVGMAKTIGVATLSLADCFGQMRPDLIVLTADRYEMLAPASVALALRIPLAHIEGGEISEGAIDDAVRNALTKLSHIHFTSTELARARVIAMGEEEWRVHRVGAPALDHLRRSPLLSREQLETRLGIDLSRALGSDVSRALGIDVSRALGSEVSRALGSNVSRTLSGDPSSDVVRGLGRPTTVITLHPATIAQDTTREADALFGAAKCIPGQLLFCYPNADAGSRSLIDRIEQFSRERGGTKIFVNLEPIVYWSLLQFVDLLLGNSSSGIIEAASLELPAVNVGIRQRGRERGRNVLDADAAVDSILDRVKIAMSPGFRESLKGMENLYGDGHAAGRIAGVLAWVQLGEELLIKRARPLEGSAA
jgi:UDP-N-acetylglucosamine 2-epimerase (non-hydrolysing)/GDP/UDP-N,N'-diacetylbacillosamine 2-epimerase (hydrolysing)